MQTQPVSKTFPVLVHPDRSMGYAWGIIKKNALSCQLSENWQINNTDLSPPPPPPPTHTHMYTCAHRWKVWSLTHTNMHAHSLIQVHTHAHIQARARAHTHTHAHTFPFTTSCQIYFQSQNPSAVWEPGSVLWMSGPLCRWWSSHPGSCRLCPGWTWSATLVKKPW